MCWTPLYTNKNTTHYVLDTIIRKDKNQFTGIAKYMLEFFTQIDVYKLFGFPVI